MTDNELILRLKTLVKNERELLMEILRHLCEVEKWQLFLARGHSSMFTFCTEALGYSPAETQIRLQAMRLMQAVPLVGQKIEQGELSLSVAAKAQSCFHKEKVGLEQKLIVLEQLSGTSTRTAEKNWLNFFQKK